ncbi:hypothetical protein JW921_02845, partial [Candidatus Fermentibacterales bacterium]|nr:hypothetical protein [Candidatus Fermentibacterales bacterium]
MKRWLLVTIATAAVAFASSHDVVSWQSLGGQTGSEASVELVEADLEHMILDIDVPGFFMYSYPAGGNVWDRIELPGYYNQGTTGMPELPAITRLFALPFGSQPEVTVEQVELALFSGVSVLP